MKNIYQRYQQQQLRNHYGYNGEDPFINDDEIEYMSEESSEEEVQTTVVHSNVVHSNVDSIVSTSSTRIFDDSREYLFTNPISLGQIELFKKDRQNLAKTYVLDCGHVRGFAKNQIFSIQGTPVLLIRGNYCYGVIVYGGYMRLQSCLDVLHNEHLDWIYLDENYMTENF